MTPLILSVLAIQLNLANLQLQQMQPTAYASVMNAQDYFDYASSTAISYGVDPSIFTKTLECESGFNPNAVGDHGTSYGVSQIHLPAHKDITKEEALDPIWSINWSAKQFASGNAHIWSCWRQLN